MKGAVVVVAMVMMVLFTGVTHGEKANPTIEILPDTILNPNEQELVVGSGWTPNGTVRIDLVLPDGTYLQGVVSAYVNSTGGFKATFTSPNAYGTGYVKAVEGTIVVSKQVFFNGYSGGGELEVSWYPQPIYTNETVTFTVQASFLSSKNYVLDMVVFYPNMEVIYYAVLHNGIGQIQTEFKDAGNYYLLFRVEDTPYNKTVEVQVLKGSSHQTPSYGNISILITPMKGGTKGSILAMYQDGTPASGIANIINPDGTIQVVSIVDGAGAMNFVEAGTYIIQFKDNRTGSVTTKNYDYEPKITVDISNFDKNGEATITVYVNGDQYSGDTDATVTLPDGTMTQLMITEGQGTLRATEQGVYTISLNILGKQIQSTTDFEDTPIIEDLEVYQSNDLNYLIITGYVYGEISGKPLSNEKVEVSSWDLSNGYAETKTDVNGNFMIKIPLTSSDRGKSVTITISVGNTQKERTVMLQASWSDNAGWYVFAGFLVFIIILVILYKMGYIKTRIGRRSGGAMINPRR